MSAPAWWHVGAAFLAAAVTGDFGAGPGLGARMRRLEGRYHAKQGHERSARGDLRGAVRAYQAALATDPGLLELHLHLGYAHERVSRWSRPADAEREEALRRAVICYREVAERVPGLRRLALLRLAMLHAPGELNEPGLLERDLQDLVELPRPEPDWFLALARLREDGRRIAEAEATLLAARAALPQAAAVHRELARFYRRYERLDALFGALERRLEQAPDDRDALFALAEGCFYRIFRDHRIGPERRLGYVERGLAAAGRLLRLEPKHAAARHYRRLLSRLQDENGGGGG